MNDRQRATIERFLRLEFQLQLDNILFGLRSSIREGRPLTSAEVILLTSNLQRLRSSSMEVLDILDAERESKDLNLDELWENIELAS